MKKIISIVLMCFILSIPAFAKAPPKAKAPVKKKGTITKIKDAAVRGFGWGLGREAAKSTVNGIKKGYHSEPVQNAKDKVIETGKKIVGKDDKK